MRYQLILVALFASACGGPSAPTAPASGFLSGRWSGTLTITRAGQSPVSGPTTWTFDLLPNTAGYSYRATIASSNPWLMTTIVATADLVAPGEPPAGIFTEGPYPSPRGCQGQFGSLGTADAHRLTASFHGVDCDNMTFDGTVELRR